MRKWVSARAGPALSVSLLAAAALAVTETVPLTVAPLAGALIDTVGGVVLVVGFFGVRWWLHARSVARQDQQIVSTTDSLVSQEQVSLWNECINTSNWTTLAQAYSIHLHADKPKAGLGGNGAEILKELEHWRRALSAMRFRDAASLDDKAPVLKAALSCAQKSLKTCRARAGCAADTRSARPT